MEEDATKRCVIFIYNLYFIATYLQKKSTLSKFHLQLIATEPQLPISDKYMQKIGGSQIYKYCKRIVNEPQFHLAAIEVRLLNG